MSERAVAFTKEWTHILQSESSVDATLTGANNFNVNFTRNLLTVTALT